MSWVNLLWTRGLRICRLFPLLLLGYYAFLSSLSESGLPSESNTYLLLKTALHSYSTRIAEFVMQRHHLFGVFGIFIFFAICKRLWEISDFFTMHYIFLGRRSIVNGLIIMALVQFLQVVPISALSSGYQTVCRASNFISAIPRWPERRSSIIGLRNFGGMIMRCIYVLRLPGRCVKCPENILEQLMGPASLHNQNIYLYDNCMSTEAITVISHIFTLRKLLGLTCLRG